MTDKSLLDGQQTHWNQKFANKADMFGTDPSYSAIEAVKVFQEKGVETILELGAGQGRDTFYFLKEGFKVHVLDYSEEGIRAINDKAKELGYQDKLTCQQADLREKLELSDDAFDACYSHMLYCMAFTQQELKLLTNEVRRVLKPGGIHAYTSRNTTDADYGQGNHLGENIYESGGFIIQFIDDHMIEEYNQGFKMMDIIKFDEGGLPRKLSLIIQEKL